jgi:hypothetical protein
VYLDLVLEPEVPLEVPQAPVLVLEQQNPPLQPEVQPLLVPACLWQQAQHLDRGLRLVRVD